MKYKGQGQLKLVCCAKCNDVTDVHMRPIMLHHPLWGKRGTQKGGGGVTSTKRMCEENSVPENTL